MVLVGAVFGGCLLCGGIGAALGIPAFITFQRRSRSAEVHPRLEHLFREAAVYYAGERVVDGVLRTHCTVGAATTPNAPGPNAVTIQFSSLPSFAVLEEIDDVGRFRYEIEAGPSRCDVGAGQPVYTFRARGDLDADGLTSLFEISVTTSSEGDLVRTPGLYIENELE